MSDLALVKQVFQKYDTDGDGTISKQEMMQLLVDLDGDTWTLERTDLLISCIDHNSDGKIAVEEFVDWIFNTPTGADRRSLQRLVHKDPKVGEAQLCWQQAHFEGGNLIDDGCSLVVSEDRIVTCLAGILVPPVGACRWSWFLNGSPVNARAWIEFGITLEGGDITNDSVSAKIAPKESKILTTCGICKDGELVAEINMETGSFSIAGCPDALDGPTCALACEETRPEVVHHGVGSIRGHLWRPFLRCSRANGFSVKLGCLQVSGRSEGLVLQAALAAGQGDPKSLATLRALLPGSGGQPAPGINDIQCVLPADLARKRGGLYISNAAAATAPNLEKINATAVLRFGKYESYKPLPPTVSVKIVEIEDTCDEDFARYIDACNGFLEERLASSKNVLVHCGAGVSRSGSAVIAYLMLSCHLRYQQALKSAQTAREWIRPNVSFALQLEQYEAELAKNGHYGDGEAEKALSGLGSGFADVQCVRQPSDGIGGLYISGASGATYRNLSLLNICALIRVGGFSTPPEKADLEQLDLALDDSEEADLLGVLDQAIPYAERKRKIGKNVLVHCGAGISRSAAVVTAVLMQSEHMSADEAVSVVKSARRWAGPNPGFLRQLREWK